MPVSICLLVYNASDKSREKWLDVIEEGFDSSSKVSTVVDFLDIYGKRDEPLEEGLTELAARLQDFQSNDVICLVDDRQVNLIGDPLAGAALLYRSTCHVMVSVSASDQAPSDADGESGAAVSLPKMPRNAIGRHPDASCVIGYAGALGTVVGDRRIINRSKGCIQKFWRQAFLKSILAAKRGVEWPLIGLDYWGEACIGESGKGGRAGSKPCFQKKRNGSGSAIFIAIAILAAVLVVGGGTACYLVLNKRQNSTDATTQQRHYIGNGDVY